MKLHDPEYCPKVVEGLEFNKLFESEREAKYCLGSPNYDRYIQVNEKNVLPIETAIEYMDGSNSIESIEEMMLKKKIKISISDLSEWLGKAGLLDNPPEDVKYEKQEMDYLATTIKSWSLEKIYGFLTKLSSKYWKGLIYSTVAIILAGICIILKDWRMLINITNYKVNGSFALGIVMIMAIFTLSIGAHEMSHAVVGYRYGLKPKAFVFALYMGMPMFYVKMPGIYTVEPNKRVKVWSAGVYMNMVIASFCLVCMQFTSGWIYNLAIICCSTNISLVLGNISPLLPLDGYFIMSTLLKKPNLRKDSYRYFKNWFLRRENNFRGLYVVYFLASITFYIAIVVAEVKWFAQVIKYGIDNHFTAIDYVYAFKYIILIIGVVLFKKVIEAVVNTITGKRNVAYE